MVVVMLSGVMLCDYFSILFIVCFFGRIDGGSVIGRKSFCVFGVGIGYYWCWFVWWCFVIYGDCFILYVISVCWKYDFSLVCGGV